MVTVRVETEVELDVALMAKTFAYMGSDEQAQFLALVHQQMGEYTREHRDGTTATLGSYGREMQMLSIKERFCVQPDAKEFIRTLYEMTHEEDKDTDVAKEAREQAKTILGGAGHFNWDNPPGDIMEDMRKAKAAIEADTGLKPSYQYIGTPIANIRDKELVKTLAYEAATDYLTGGSPLEVLSESVSWETAPNSMNPSREPRILCYCKHPTGVWHKVDDRVCVEYSPSKRRWGHVTKVCADGNVQVLLDAVTPTKGDLEKAKAAIKAGPHYGTRITVSRSMVNIVQGFVYTRGAGVQGAYLGTVVSESEGMDTVTIEAAPRSANHPRSTDATVIDFLDRNRKEVGDLITSDDLVSPNADTAPNVTERCQECKGTGTWTSPFTNETTPCSRGCKS